MSMILKKRTVTTITKDTFVPGKPFNPNFDGNLLAWYDGDTLATDPANTWTDRSANGYDLTLFNAPTIQAGAINGHDALRFDGINQYAQRLLTPANLQPSTFYIVLKNIVWANALPIYDSANGASRNALYMLNAIGDVFMYVTAFSPNVNMAVNAYDITTNLFNNITSEIRLNNAVAVVGNPGANGFIGLTLGSNFNLANFSNVEIAYLIIRSGADNTATQNIFINWLKNRFAL